MGYADLPNFIPAADAKHGGDQPFGLQKDDQRAIAIWLLLCCTLIFAMVVLGGVTRLTGSGLSMVEWEPVMGTIPPRSENEWQETFELYQQFPEYQKKNIGMNLHQFKSIFWFEYAHRLLGRSIGIVFLLPFLYGLFRKRIPKKLIPRLATLFVLGGLQGLLGWYMVKSGLVNDPHVSQYRLTAHLSMAFLIYAYMFWLALDVIGPATSRTAPQAIKGRRFAWWVTLCIALTVIAGGFVAGIKAGFAYNTFPLMDGHWIPPNYFHLKPEWHNLFENIATVQFNHRVLAICTLVLTLSFWIVGQSAARTSRARVGLHMLAVMAVIQVGLGISTLLLHVPVSLASAHQAGALMLFTLALFTTHAFSRQ